MIEGYAYALKINGREIKPWITGKDGALRDVNLQRFVHNWEVERGVRVATALIIDQRTNEIKVSYPAPVSFFP